MKPTQSLVIAALVLLGGQPAAAEETSSAKPNIVYFLIDDLGYADCGFNGGKDIQTPNIDRLAGDGAVLKALYAQPVCSPTRSALLTGRYPAHTGVYNVVRPGAGWGLPLNERLLPQALREAGYTTAICGKWHLGEFEKAYLPTRRGFDHQYGHWFGAIDYFTHTRDGKADWYRDDQPLVEQGYTTHLIAKEACRLIREQPAGKPLFLYMPFNGVHGPYQVPEKYMEPYQKLPKARRALAGMLSAVDEAIGQIMNALAEKDMARNTLVIFSSDNGGPAPGKITMNTPLRAGKSTIYEGGVRVAAFATFPGKIKPGGVIEEPLHVVDWYPTLLTLAGASKDQKLAPDGRDIWPVLTQGAKSPHEAILLCGMPNRGTAIRMGDWKLLVEATERDDEKPGNRTELYNLADDIAEAHNLATTQPDRVKTMRERLDAMLKDAVPPGDAAQKPAKQGGKVKRPK